jgi:hypothetical protein
MKKDIWHQEKLEDPGFTKEYRKKSNIKYIARKRETRKMEEI